MLGGKFELFQNRDQKDTSTIEIEFFLIKTKNGTTGFGTISRSFFLICFSNPEDPHHMRNKMSYYFANLVQQ